MMFRREEDIVPMIDALRALRLDRIVPTATIANWMRIAAGNTTRAEWYDGRGALPQEAVERLIRGWASAIGACASVSMDERNCRRKTRSGGRGVLPHRWRRGDRRHL